MAAKKGKKSAGKTATKAKEPVTKSALALGDDVRPKVVAIMASVTGQPIAKIGALCLSDLAAPCNLILRGRTASELNAEWPALIPLFKPTDVACADTADTLSHQVRQRLP
jgi:hypothetical protein